MTFSPAVIDGGVILAFWLSSGGLGVVGGWLL